MHGAFRLDVGPAEAIRFVELVAHGDDATEAGAVTPGHQYLAVGAQVPEHILVLGGIDSAFHNADINLLKVLEVGDRAGSDVYQLDHIQNLLIDVQEGHVTTGTAG